MLTNPSFSNNPGEANKQHDSPDVQHASNLWVKGALKRDRTSDSRANPNCLCNSNVQALLIQPTRSLNG
jgi:hypothetical protein